MAGIIKSLFFCLLAFLLFPELRAQVTDSSRLQQPAADSLRMSLRDTVVRHDPRIATIRSAIIPGWGQATNRKYWKIPIVYAAVGIPVGTFLYNKKWYGRTRDVAKMIANNDTANYRSRVDSKFFIFFESAENSNPDNALRALTTYRNEFRRNMDYSLLFVLLFWGLNVVDATVDAQLRDFDISNNLSMRLKPILLEGGTTAGLGLVFTFGGNHANQLSSAR